MMMGGGEDREQSEVEKIFSRCVLSNNQQKATRKWVTCGGTATVKGKKKEFRC